MKHEYLRAHVWLKGFFWVKPKNTFRAALPVAADLLVQLYIYLFA